MTVEQYERGSKAMGHAGVECQGIAAQQAKFDADRGWTGIVDSWRMTSASMIEVTGSALKLQNGFGAWRRVTYTCTYNIDTQHIALIDVH